MFRPLKINPNEIKIKSTDLNITAKTKADEKLILEKLLALIKLVSLKFGIEHIEGRFNKLAPKEVSIIFSAVFVGSENSMKQEYLKAVMYLSYFGKASKENKTPYPHLASIVITINKKKINDIMNELATPTKEDVKDRGPSRAFAKC